MQFDTSNDFFEKVIYQSTGQEVSIQFIHFVTGGCINQTVRLDTDQGLFFLKWNEQPMLQAFEAEAKGLDLLAQYTPITIPKVLGIGKIEEKSYILLEFIDAHAYKSNYWELLGEGLAVLHGKSQQKFGLHFDNYIGKLPQQNILSANWLEFFIEYRLKPQFGRAYYNGLIEQSFMSKLDKLRQRLEGFFPKEIPALLHGDLWSGNVISDQHGKPCMVDPAIYYGHREMELAFTKLFGGFPEEFYDSYHANFPLSPDFAERVAVYNIYPLMVHVNLFGMSYFSGVTKTLGWLGV